MHKAKNNQNKPKLAFKKIAITKQNESTHILVIDKGCLSVISPIIINVLIAKYGNTHDSVIFPPMNRGIVNRNALIVERSAIFLSVRKTALLNIKMWAINRDIISMMIKPIPEYPPIDKHKAL